MRRLHSHAPVRLVVTGLIATALLGEAVVLPRPARASSGARTAESRAPRRGRLLGAIEDPVDFARQRFRVLV